MTCCLGFPGELWNNMGWADGMAVWLAGGCGVHDVGIMCMCFLVVVVCCGLPGWDKYHVRVGV